MLKSRSEDWFPSTRRPDTTMHNRVSGVFAYSIWLVVVLEVSLIHLHTLEVLDCLLSLLQGGKRELRDKTATVLEQHHWDMLCQHRRYFHPGWDALRACCVHPPGRNQVLGISHPPVATESLGPHCFHEFRMEGTASSNLNRGEALCEARKSSQPGLNLAQTCVCNV